MVSLMITGKVLRDIYLPQENYKSTYDTESLSMKKYSVLDVNPLSTQQIDDLIDRIVEGFKDFSPYGSCKSIRIRDVCKDEDDSRTRYIAVCGECPRDYHSTVMSNVKAKVDEIAGTSVIYVKKPVNLSVREKTNKPNLIVYKSRR